MPEELPRIIIVGAGFGGVFTAKHLSNTLKGKAHIELINVNNYFVFQPLLPEVASGTLSAQDAVAPLRVIAKGVKVRQAEVISIDKENKVIQLLQGSRRTLIDIAYDHLVLTSGTEANSSFVEGMGAHALTIKNLSDAYQIRNHIIQCLEWADVTISPETKKRLLTFVVAGGGFSGVETAGEIVEMLHRSLKYYPNISKEELRPVIVEFGSALLPELHEKLGKYTEEKFKKRGIEILLNESVAKVTDRNVLLGNGESIATATVISSIGNRPPKFIESLGVDLVRQRVATERDLRVKDAENFWALGDIALIPMDDSGESFAPPTAQFAVQEAKRCAKNIVAAIEGKPIKPFAYKPRGSLASLGSYTGVGELMGVRVSGILGWAIWRGFYIMKIPGFATKVRITLNWFFDYIFPRSIVHLQQQHGDSLEEQHYLAGDVVFHKGQLLDALYVVKSGKCSLKGDEGFKREFVTGEHFGEKLIEKNLPLTGEFVAEEDSVIIKLKRGAFTQLRETMPVIDEYFAKIDQSKYTHGVRD